MKQPFRFQGPSRPLFLLHVIYFLQFFYLVSEPRGFHADSELTFCGLHELRKK